MILSKFRITLSDQRAKEALGQRYNILFPLNTCFYAETNAGGRDLYKNKPTAIIINVVISVPTIDSTLIDLWE